MRSHAWSAADDKLLRQMVGKYRIGNTEPDWGTIALKCNFGHNSGSCKARFESLPALRYEGLDQLYFPGNGKPAKLTCRRAVRYCFLVVGGKQLLQRNIFKPWGRR